MWRWGLLVRVCLIVGPPCWFCLAVRNRVCWWLGINTVLHKRKARWLGLIIRRKYLT